MMTINKAEKRHQPVSEREREREREREKVKSQIDVWRELTGRKSKPSGLPLVEEFQR